MSGQSITFDDKKKTTFFIEAENHLMSAILMLVE